MTAPASRTMLHAVLHLPPPVAVGGGIAAAAATTVAAFDPTAILIAAIAAVPATLAALGALWVGIRNSRKADEATAHAAAAALEAIAAKEAAQASQAELVRTSEGIFVLGKRIDGQMDKIIAATLVEGVAKGTDAERVRQEGIGAAHAEGVAEGQRRGQDEHPDPVAGDRRAAPTDVRVVQEPDAPAVRVKPDEGAG